MNIEILGHMTNTLPWLLVACQNRQHSAERMTSGLYWHQHLSRRGTPP